MDDEHATAGPGATLHARVRARRAYLVLSSAGDQPRRVEVLVDGRHYRTVTVRRQKLYTLVDLLSSRAFDLTLKPEAGLSGYAFTFG